MPDLVSPQSFLNTAQIEQFHRSGYVVLPGFVSESLCADAARMVEGSLVPLVGPAEFEADVGYPGAPMGRDREGGATPRRLLHAYARGGALRELAVMPALGQALQALLPGSGVMLSQCHHNCVMTKTISAGK